MILWPVCREVFKVYDFVIITAYFIVSSAGPVTLPLFICPVPCALWKLVCVFVSLLVSFSVSVVIPLRQGRMSAAHIDLNVHFWNVCREAFHCISSKLLKLLMLLLNHCALQSFFPRFFFFLSFFFSFYLAFKSWLLDWSHFPLVAWLAMNPGSLFCCRSDVLQASPGDLRMKNLTVPGAGCSCCSWACVDVWMCTLYLNPCFSSHAEILQGLICCCLSSLDVSWPTLY